MQNQRGGIIAKVLFIPIGIVLVIGFFFLGYFVGKYQSKAGSAPADAAPPLPEIESKQAPKPEDLTFYKTLTDKSDKTVSIDLHPAPAGQGEHDAKKSSGADKAEEKGTQTKKEKTAATAPVSASKQPLAVKKENTSSALKNTKVRYTLQIASYQEKGMADDDIKKMKQRGYAAFVVASDLPGKGTWYRVRLGSFSSKTSAEKLQKELHAKEGISPIITIE